MKQQVGFELGNFWSTVECFIHLATCTMTLHKINDDSSNYWAQWRSVYPSIYLPNSLLQVSITLSELSDVTTLQLLIYR